MSTCRVSKLSLLVLVAGVLGGCESLSAPDTNNPQIESLTEAPTRAVILSAARGVFVSSRANSNNATGLVSLLGIVGRESYNLDRADPRWVAEMLIGPLDPSAFGGFMWGAPYRDIRQVNLIVQALDEISDTDMPPAEKQAVRGFVLTMQANDFLEVIVTRDELGAPIDVGGDIEGPLAPIESKRAVYDHIVQLLQDGNAALQATSLTEMPFDMPSGFDGFDTPAALSEFNRALAARVFVYMGGEFGETSFYDQALTALDNSFLDEAADLDLGVYHSFSGSSGDTPNGLFAPGDQALLRAHPSFRADAETQEGSSELDARVLRKTRVIPPLESDFQGVNSGTGIDVYESTSAPIPIIRNEELILLRAEANIGLNNLGDARDDINLVRTTSGNLAEVDPFGSQQEALDQLLFEKRYSLFFEGGHRWIDMRRYDRLDELPLDLPDHTVHTNFPFPDEETRGR